jgi:hypothetical protein
MDATVLIASVLGIVIVVSSLGALIRNLRERRAKQQD